MNLKNRKAAIEMSMTTIVTIVLVVVTLVLALVLIRSIFSSSTNAVTQVNNAIQNQINQLFTSQSTNLVVYPEDASVTVKRGDSTPAGFAFAVKNPDNNQATFTYNVTAQQNSDGSVGHNCGSGFTAAEANSYDQGLGSSGTIGVGPSAISQTQVQDQEEVIRLR